MGRVTKIYYSTTTKKIACLMLFGEKTIVFYCTDCRQHECLTTDCPTEVYCGGVHGQRPMGCSQNRC
jgi:hypothetical protein